MTALAAKKAELAQRTQSLLASIEALASDIRSAECLMPPNPYHPGCLAIDVELSAAWYALNAATSAAERAVAAFTIDQEVES